MPTVLAAVSSEAGLIPTYSTHGFSLLLSLLFTLLFNFIPQSETFLKKFMDMHNLLLIQIGSASLNLQRSPPVTKWHRCTKNQKKLFSLENETCTYFKLHEIIYVFRVV